MVYFIYIIYKKIHIIIENIADPFVMHKLQRLKKPNLFSIPEIP